MRKITLSLFTILLSLSLSAQYYYLPFINAGENPGGLHTEEDQTVAYMLGNYTGYSQILASSATPEWSAQQTIPFAFNFNGTNFTSYYASNNGVLTFSSTPGTVPSNTNVAIPDASIPDNSILVWGLNCAGSNDGAISKTFGTAPNRQHWVIYASVSHVNLTGTSNWTYWGIVLEETTNNVYIVDMRTYGTGNVALTAGLQFNATSALSITGSPALGSINPSGGGSDVGPDDNSYYMFAQGTQPQYDMSTKSIDMDYYLKLSDAPFTVRGSIINLGSETITSLDLNYTVNGGTPTTVNLTGLSIAPLSTYNFTHPTKWTPTAAGDYSIAAYASNLNGNTDANTGNDVRSTTVVVVDEFAQRFPFYEIFTSSTCAPCKPGNENFHGVVAGKEGEFVEIKYQQDFPGTGDPYCTDESYNRRQYYAINSIPRMEIDGGWDQNAASFTTALHNDAKNVPSFIELDANFAIDESTKEVNVEVTLSTLASFPSSNNTLHVAIVEKTTFDNVKSNGETEFKYVMKKMVPSGNGTSLGALASGVTNTYNLDFTFQGDYRLPLNGSAAQRIDHSSEHSVEEFSDLAVVVWVQEAVTKEVFQSVNATKTNVSTAEVANNEFSFEVYPNPANEFAYIDFKNVNSNVHVTVVDALGNLVADYQTASANRFVLDTKNLSQGVYFVSIETNGNTQVQKLMVTE